MKTLPCCHDNVVIANSPSVLRITPLAICISLLLSAQPFFSYAYAKQTNTVIHEEETAKAEMETTLNFDLSFLQGGENIDPSIFSIKGANIIPGEYLVDLYVNNQFIQTINVDFKKVDNEIKGCIPIDALIQAGLKSELTENIANQSCVFLNDIVSGATEDFLSTELRYQISIPTVYMNKRTNYAPPSQWTYGVNAAFINYYANYYRNVQQSNPFSHGADDSLFVNFNTGINLGKWRLRSQINYSNRGDRRFDTNSTYLQRALPKLRSELTLGQTFTSGLLFDGLSFRGARINSDERMLPRDKRGYAPVISGTASSNALLKIYQNSMLIREVSVPPGPFYIADLEPLYNSDIHVEVHEENGEIKTFTVPSTTVNQALRAGLSRYSFSFGETHEKNLANTLFEEFTFEYGLTNYLTLNTGFQVTNNDYLSATVGAVFPTQIGTFGINAYYSYLNKSDTERDGWMYKASYQHSFNTDTALAFAYEHRDKNNYSTLLDSLGYEHNGRLPASYNKYQRIEARVSQSLFGYGHIYGNAIFQNTHNHHRFDEDYQIGYSNRYKWLTYNVFYSKQKRQFENNDESISLFVSFPIGSHKLSPTISTGIVHNLQDHSGQLQASAYGTLDEANSLNYSLRTTRELKDNHHTTLGIGLNKQTSVGSYGLSYSRSDYSSQFSANAQGALVIFDKGISFGQYLGDSFAIVEAPNAYGASVEGMTNVKINRQGYAVVPSLFPYSYNRVALDPATLESMDVELKQTEKYIAPYSGAITKVTFATVTGKSILVTSHLPTGESLPVGAIVQDDLGIEVGMVGQGSQIFARVINPEGQLTVRWGEGYYQQCRIAYHITDMNSDEYIIPLTATCVPLTAAP